LKKDQKNSQNNDDSEMHNGKQILKELGSSSGKESKDTDRKRFNEYPSFIEDQVKN
jgi:hypothetical protein